MNSLKPLLIVAVLAGIGYGVYVRLNTGGGAPPVVTPGWDTIPQVQLPDQASAPWDSAPSQGGPGVSPGQGMSEAPAYQPPSTAGAGEAPPFGAPPAEAPGAGPPAHHAAPPQEAVAGMNPPGGAAGPGGAPYEYLPPHDADSPQEPSSAAQPADPYADPYAGSDIPDRYPMPEEGPPAGADVPPGAGVPADGGPADYAPAEAYPSSDYPPSEEYPPAGGSPAGGDAAGVTAALESARRELEGGQLASALRQLSAWYDHPQLAPPEQNELNALLDQVAGTVVYSTQNLLEPPYEVQPGETLQDIGEKYNVPWQLLAKINGIDDPAALRGGERLKVVRGPFQAVVNLQKRELALMTHDGLYAGRFRIGLGSDQPPQEGTFAVSEKMVNPVYHGRGRALGAEDPANPLGERWIGLGKQMAIHGTNDPSTIGRENLPGSISLSERDAEDVFDILSLGSRVTIRR